MNIEESRLRTFTDWPVNATVDAARIAKAGFYYTGHALEVQCFLCGVKISDWNYGDQAIVRHRLAEPNCPFVQNPSSTCNVPLIPIPINNLGLASSSTETSQDNNIVECQSINLYQNKEPQKECKVMSQRLQSFTNWPISSIVSPEKLAKAGFYYLQHDDDVQCTYCGGILRKWKLGDDPERKHKEYFPNCNFYVHQDKDDLGIQIHTTPKKPDCATYEGRLRTFNGWPENIKQTPEILASAGFYYDGFGDHVRCFHCDGGLRNWEATDDAWTEHARWFPKCEFVNLVRGQEFIKHCINNRPPLDQSIFEGVTEDESTDTAEVPPTTIPSLEITEATLKKLLESPPAMEALEVGLHVGRVKRALKKRMEEIGTPYTNSDQLIEDVLCDQIMEESTREQTNSGIEQCNTVKKDEYRVCSIEDGNSVIFNDKSNTDKKTNFKESTALEEENRKLKEARLCKICMDREIAIVFLPCGHLATCVYCAPSLTYCLMCRQEIKATVRTFLS
ncbi:baculoviral IAP repeat-containing protein 7 isoform X2 [Bombus pascuorum]|uniref:baculoviral IAP repeat-containing protein 7 isoform X2 n=1 Tax=Bombus pascuorum TaxID=65598 RepID=UPI00298E12FF|nr:baculoviral IAP repeat-containing protein 7 isoform X2 [Bombus pascuorum]